MNAYVACVGCEQRELDSQRVISYLGTNGVNVLDNPSKADYVIVITCGVDSSNSKESINKIKEIKAEMPSTAKLIVGGCLPSIDSDALESYDIHHSFSPRSMDSLDEVLKLETPIKETAYPNTSIYDDKTSATRETSARARFEMAKNGYKVRIAEGCLGQCTYCSIKEATGLLNSESLDSVLSQIEAGARQGEPTMMLMAGDTGSYGQDIKTNFAALLDEIVGSPGDFQIYIHDFGVDWLIKDLSDYLDVFEKAELNKRIGGITLPIQSGSNSVLRLMKRRYDVADVVSALNSIDKYSFDIGTHIMIGFPGEGEEDFDDTLNMLSKINFDFVTCFPYSENRGAASAELPGKVPPVIVNERLDKISDLLGNRVKVIR